MSGELELNCHSSIGGVLEKESLYLVSKLRLEISLYEEGLMRVAIDEKGGNKKRFRLSKSLEKDSIIMED